MIIHTVQPNDTIDSIAAQYGVSVERLIADNQIMNPDRLVVGQTLVVLIPAETYQVQEGDTLADIAASHGVSVMQLLRNNPQLANQMYLYPGEELIISYTTEKIREISTNGYTLPFINDNVLQLTLPYLTYLTIFYYRIMFDGELVVINDQELINTSLEYSVAPIMLISTLTDEMIPDMEATYSILTNMVAQEHLINRVLEIMRTKGYYGLNIDMQEIFQAEKQLFVDFIANISNRVRQEGYLVFFTLTPKTFPIESGLLYEGPEYAVLGQLTDSTMLLSYEWGHAHTPQTALPLAQARAFLDYAVTQIPPNKINIGIPTIGYIWQVPFRPGVTIANALSHESAINIANEFHVTIQHDEASEAPYFSFILDKEYIVWFRDARNAKALLNLVVEYDLEGIGIWNIMQYSPGMWLVINAQYDIKKVL